MEIHFSQGHAFTTAVIISLVVFLLTAMIYRGTFRELDRRKFFTILLLRFLAIAVVLLLLFRPVLQFSKDQTQKKSIVFAVDASESMSISDEFAEETQTPKRFEKVQEKVKTWGERLKKDFNVHLVVFSDKVDVYPDFRQIASLAPTGKSTSLSWGIAGCRMVSNGSKPVSTDEIEAVFLFSDGRHNAARDPESDAAKFGAKINTIGVGTGLASHSSFKDVRVARLMVPERLMLKNLNRITANVQSTGLSGRVVRVVLYENFSTEQNEVEQSQENAVLDTEIVLSETGDQDVVFEYRPEQIGRVSLSAQITPLDEESIRENNRRESSAWVVEPGIRVLYLEGTLRPEYGAISDRYLAKDPNVEFCALVQTRPNVFQKRTNIEDLPLNSIPNDQETMDRFDVFIIGDLDSTYLKPEIQRLIVNRVQSGAGLVMLGGYHSLGPGGYAGTPIGEILPVGLGDRDIGQLTAPFLPKLTPDGQQSQILTNITEFFPTNSGDAKTADLPPLDGCTKIASISPAATVLAVCPGEILSDGREMPVLAVQPFGEGRTAVFTADTTRKWQQAAKALSQETPFIRFWGQLIRFLAHREGTVNKEAGCSAEVDRTQYEPEENIQISATVKNNEGEGTDKAMVIATIIHEDGTVETVELRPNVGTIGKYAGSFSPSKIGRIQVRVQADWAGKKLEAPDEIIVDVGRANMEFDQLNLNEDLLVRIAQIRHGQYSHITNADFMIEQLDRRTVKNRIEKTVELAPPLPLWIVFVFALSIEWYLRRRYHLK